ncbi:MAG TPA: preprotein translocase subunit SecE [Euzebyales bacterium]|nr:preprotein translocase subunit SecE [Euzebyales bacterium]
MQAKSADAEHSERRPDPPSQDRKRRFNLVRFLREVQVELRRVHWPSRREVASYSLVVLVAVSLLTTYVALLDRGFGQLVLWMFQ